MLAKVDQVKEAAAKRAVSTDKCAVVAVEVDKLIAGVATLSNADVPRELLCNLIAHTLEKWCLMRYHAAKAGIQIESETPFEDVDSDAAGGECDFSSGLYIYAYAIGRRRSKSDEFKPMYSGWQVIHNMPPKWFLNTTDTVHVFSVSDQGEITKYRSSYNSSNMYLARDFEDLIRDRELDEGSYTARTCVYVLKRAED